jgi:hypothetical protein
MIRMSGTFTVPFRTPDQIRATAAAYRNSPRGRAVRAAWLNAHPNYAAAYRNSPRGRAVIADYYAANRERIAAYRAANSERILERSAAYRAANRGRIAVSQAASYAAKRAKKYGWNDVDQDNADADRPLDERVAGVRTDVEGSERVTEGILRGTLTHWGFDEDLAPRMMHMRGVSVKNRVGYRLTWDEVLTNMLREEDWGFNREKGQWERGLGGAALTLLMALAAGTELSERDAEGAKFRSGRPQRNNKRKKED